MTQSHATSPPSPGGEPSRFVSVQTRVTLLLAVAGAALIALALLAQHGWRRQVDLLLHERVQDTNRVFQRILDLRASGARVHADDYTRWDDLVDFTHKPDARWGDVYLTQSIATFDLDAAWVLNDRYELIFTANPSSDSALASPPVPLPALTAALRTIPIRHFFVRVRQRLLEVWTSPIQPSEDFERRSPIQGFYVIGRLWTAERLRELSRDADAQPHVLPHTQRSLSPVVSSSTGIVTVVVPLEGLDGRPIAEAELQTTYPLVASLDRTLRLSPFLILAGVACLMVAVGWALARWVGRPLATITDAIHDQRPELLPALAQRRDELGRLARLVEEFFGQRDKLIEAREAADVAMVAKSQFLANISHELRTPMHGILSYSRFGLKGVMTAEREVLLDDFRNIEACGSSLLSLLDDLLDLAKLEAGRMRFEFDEVPLEEVVGAAVDEYASFYHDKALRVDVRAESDLVPIVADHRKLLQVMRNLLSNAGKFTPSGGTVTVRLANADGWARVAVEDTGPGIPESELHMVFDKFVQASTTKSQSGGTGLGLAICREIVGAHGGRIWAENRSEGGARMVFELPVEGPANADDELLAASGRRELGAALTADLAPGDDTRSAA